MERYAVIDIETTGLVHQDHMITEVAVLHIDASGVHTAFHSLFAPGRDVPASVAQLTGIDNALLSAAPTFAEKAREILESLEGRIFVAHQVNFDYTFLQRAFMDCGIHWKSKRLCTMRLFKRAYPGARSASLTACCRHLGITNARAHRALSDARATAQMLQKLSALEEGKYLREELDQRNRGAVLPAALPTDALHGLPEDTGVYYFYGVHPDRPIYVGKALNIKKRVLSHFTSPHQSRRKQRFQREVRSIATICTSSEYMALLLEDAEIKHWRPPYNKAQKNTGRMLAVRTYVNRAGQTRLAVHACCGYPSELAYFHSMMAAKQWIIDKIQQWNLSPAIAGLPLDYGSENSGNPDQRTADFSSFLAECREENLRANFALIEPECSGSRSYVLVEKGRYIGFGKVSSRDADDSQKLKNEVKPSPASLLAQSVVARMQCDPKITFKSLNHEHA